MKKVICIVASLLVLSTTILSSSSVENRATKKHPKLIRTVTVLLVVDEEYRGNFPDWKQRVKNILNQACEIFYEQHSIIFELKAIGKWNSNGNSAKEIFNDLNTKWNKYDFDFLIGITADSNFNEAGIAKIYHFPPSKSAISLVSDQGSRTWRALVHELSHNFGLNHDKENSNVECFMNYRTMYYAGTWDRSHFRLIIKNQKWYGTVK
ncbi:M12 family metallo-peptidase [Caldibacillus sp. 210928-DFI.2.22]|nr:M12 family metallo-peptidase [Caldibacillus sp. 210928-DFI.2.22]